jgi:hypothetical protein
LPQGAICGQRLRFGQEELTRAGRGPSGHDVLVANARRLPLIAQNDSKSGRVDAETLARIGRSN